jgi:tRNA 2-selenouridine synthase
MVEEVEKILNVLSPAAGSNGHFGTPGCRSEVFVYCWRGGMRSGAVSWLLNLYGFKVFTLAGGYKAFRNHVLKTFEQPFDLKVLGGYTGSGKTAVLHELETNGETVIDLEKIAGHKGSAFGNLQMLKQPTQEMFENLLCFELQAATSRQVNSSLDSGFRRNGGIWLEDESQRIGNLNIPIDLWQTMRKAPLYFLEIPFEERLAAIVNDYGACDVQKLIEATIRISKRLGGMETKNVLMFLDEGNIPEAFRILLHYYDKRYLKGLHNREEVSSLLKMIYCETVTPLNAQTLFNQYQTL